MILQIWALTLVLKLFLLPTLPITPDEAYYFSWGRHLQLSYFDHPPLIALLMSFAKAFWNSSFGIRLPGVVLMHLGIWPWLLALKNMGLNKKAQMIWILLICLGPMTGLGGFIVTPDTPLIFFWGLGFYILSLAHGKRARINWLGLGAVLGLGMLSKYTMVLFPLGILFWLLWEGQIRELAKAKPWLGLAFAFLIFSPVLIWNYKNNWDSFLFQTRHGLGEQNLTNLKWSLEYIGAQIGLVNPLIMGLAIYGALKLKNKKALVIFSFLPLVFFLVTSLKSRVEANWPVCAYPALTGLALMGIQKNEKYLKRFSAAALILSGAFFILALSQVYRPWLPLKTENDRTYILRQWKEDVKVLEKYHPLYARSYQTAAYFSYFRPQDKEVFKPRGLDRKDFYDYLPQPTNFNGAYIVLDPRDDVRSTLGLNHNLEVVEVLPSGLWLYVMRNK